VLTGVEAALRDKFGHRREDRWRWPNGSGLFAAVCPAYRGRCGGHYKGQQIPRPGRRPDDAAGKADRQRWRSLFSPSSLPVTGTFSTQPTATSPWTCVCSRHSRGKSSQRDILFESDLLFRAGIARAKVLDIPMPAIYRGGNEQLESARGAPSFRNRQYEELRQAHLLQLFLRDFNIASLELVTGVALNSIRNDLRPCALGWHENGLCRSRNDCCPAPITGILLLLSFVNYDTQQLPRDTISPRLSSHHALRSMNRIRQLFSMFLKVEQKRSVGTDLLRPTPERSEVFPDSPRMPRRPGGGMPEEEEEIPSFMGQRYDFRRRRSASSMQS